MTIYRMHVGKKAHDRYISQQYQTLHLSEL